MEWPTQASQYDLIGKIGQGAFATVWRAKTKVDGGSDENRDCAVKVLNLDHVDTNLAEIRLEVQAMRLSLHPNVLPCYTAFVKDRSLWLVTQLMSKGSALHCLQTARFILDQRYRRYVQQQGEGQAPTKIRMEDHIMYILHETLLGLKYIHDNGQIHRDIKAGNLLLDGNGDVRIADFGVSGWLVQAGSQQEKAKTFVGTPCWMAPEVMEQVHGYDYQADIWSLGITALELAKGYAPYAKYPPMKVLILTIQEAPPSLDTYAQMEREDRDTSFGHNNSQMAEEWSVDFRNLVNMCLQKSPSKRPTCQQLLDSKYLNSMNTPTEREARRENMRIEICDCVADVGKVENASSDSTERFPGNVPVSIILSEGEDRQPGTTWVFADGSQIMASASPTKSTTVDDVMAQLDEFGMQTGGEHYTRGTGNQNILAHIEMNPTTSNADDDDEDDIQAFMDDFESKTAGENFRRPL